ncbi:MAG: MFS transporter [Planctomycetes bacterium]|nr:MFS transporter [Planctomycetota bacterium]
MTEQTEPVITTAADTAAGPLGPVDGPGPVVALDSGLPERVATGKIVPGVAAPAGAAVPIPAPQPGVLGHEGSRLSRNIERRTLAGGVRGALFEGVFGGLTSMNTYVAINALGDWSRWDAEITTLMSMLPSILMAFAMLYSSGGRVRKRRNYFLFVGLFGRLVVASVALLAFFPNPFFFVALVALQAGVCAGLAPALNHIWGANCTVRSRGRVFTWFSIASEIATMSAALLASTLLDRDGGRAFIYVYPIAGVVGLLGMLSFWRIRLRFTAADEEDLRTPRWTERAKRSLAQATGLLRRDPEFRLYETGFFLYGVAFMMLVPVIPVLFKNYLNASYQEFATANVVIVQVMALITIPIVVRIAAGKRVTVVTRWAHVVLVFYPVLLGATALTAAHDQQLATMLVFCAFVVFGVGMALIHFVWNLGPVAFARGRSPLPYTSTHAALVGFRASIGFPMSYVLMKLWPDNLFPIFGLSMLFFVGAGTVMTVLDRRLRAKAGHSSYTMTA